MHFPWSLRRCHQYCVTWIDAMTMKSPPEWKVDTLKKADQNWKLYQPNVKSNKEKSTQKGSLCKLKDNVYPKIGKKMWKNKFYIKNLHHNFGSYGMPYDPCNLLPIQGKLYYDTPYEVMMNTTLLDLVPLQYTTSSCCCFCDWEGWSIGGGSQLLSLSIKNIMLLSGFWVPLIYSTLLQI